MTAPDPAQTNAAWVVVGIDNGGTSNNATVLTAATSSSSTTSSRCRAGSPRARRQRSRRWSPRWTPCWPHRHPRARGARGRPGHARARQRRRCHLVPGLDQLLRREWWGFDIRGALEARLGLPVVYNNDGNAAALYAHHEHFGADAVRRSSVAAIVGTGLGGGVVERGRSSAAPPAWPASWAT